MKWHVNNNKMSSQTLYDYIVVGGGTSGCVIAARLSEDPNTKVLLLEAGGDDSRSDVLRVPGNLAATHKTKYDWNYQTVPQKHACKAFKDSVCVWPRGKVLGGSSSINGLAYVRGHHEDYDSWERMGCSGWGWKDVLPYFHKLENFIGAEYTGSNIKSNMGPVTISNHLFGRTQASRYFLKAGLELGYECIDVNNDTGVNHGFGDLPSTVDINGDRCSTATAYLHPVIHRENLTVFTNAHVTKVDIKNYRALGVYADVNNKTYFFVVSKDVILSGGTINSPQILMLSGIGPRHHLDQVGIECIQDLPVGQNLQDHLDIHIKADVKAGSDVFTVERTIPKSNQSEVAAFVNIKDRTWPDLEIQPLSLFYPFGLYAPILYPLKSSTYYPYFGFDKPAIDFKRREGYTYQLILLHPESRGEIRLKNDDPFCHPIIDPHYLESESDVDVLVGAIKLAKRISESEAMQLKMKHVDLQMPGSPHATWSEDNLKEFVRHFAWTLYHPVGTCKMGRTNDPTAVVDPNLRVRGIKGLRVVDASIMPHLTSGNTMAPSIMIGEKAADLIIQESQMNTSKL